MKVRVSRGSHGDLHEITHGLNAISNRVRARAFYRSRDFCHVGIPVQNMPYLHTVAIFQLKRDVFGLIEGVSFHLVTPFPVERDVGLVSVSTEASRKTDRVLQ